MDIWEVSLEIEAMQDVLFLFQQFLFGECTRCTENIDFWGLDVSFVQFGTDVETGGAN